MNNADANNLSRQKIQQLLAAVGTGSAEYNTQIQATEYNWHQPHYFGTQQLKKIDEVVKKFATATADKFTSLCQKEFNATIASVTQHYASEFYEQQSDNQLELFQPFGTNTTNICGLVAVPHPTAIAWTRLLLGDSETEDDSGKDLSQLEVSLLSDICSSIIDAFSSSYESFDFHPVQGFIKGQFPLKLKSSEELFKITFNVNLADSEKASDAYLLILCSKLAPVAEKTAPIGENKELSKQETSKAIVRYIEQIYVYVKAQLSSTSLTLDQILNLQVDDILVLDKRVDEPIELIVNGQRICRGWPAKSAGQYAVVIK